MVEVIEKNGVKYLVLERNEKEHIYEFAILKDLSKDEERTVIPKDEVLAVIAEFTNERRASRRYSLRWGWGTIILRIEKNSIGGEDLVAYYVPCEKQFIEYCEKRGEKVYLGESVYYEPRQRWEGHGFTYLIYCSISRTLYIVYTPYSEHFAKKLENELTRNQELLKELINEEKVREIFRLNVSDDTDYSIVRSLERMIEKNEGCTKIEIPEDIAKKIAESVREKYV
jgi:hypothetical protein